MFKNITNAIKRAPKRSIAIAATAVGIAIAVPVAVGAWGDSNDGRKSYTVDQINSGVLGDSIVMNSISDSAIGDEKNFVGIREDTGTNSGKDNVWHDSVKVEEDKTYLVRLYVHNNSPKEYEGVAKDVTTTFSIPSTIGKSVEVNGYIDTSNANPKTYWDNATFTSDRNFSLAYVSGSALLENNGIGKNGGVALGDSIVDGASGVKIGYDSLNGEVPGCFKFASYVTIKVKPVFADDYLVEKTVRNEGSKDWQETVSAKIGDTVHFQIHYRNLTDQETKDVMVKDILPKNMEYVKGTTVLYDSLNPTGVKIEDTITTTGVNIGGFAPNGNAYVRFSARIIDNELACGANSLTNWGQVGVGEVTKQDSASVNVEKDCPVVMEMCKIPGKTHLLANDPNCKPNELPKTGPESIIGGIIAFGSIGTAGAYYLASRKKLN